ncbi:MAG TPA: CsbD family protein [Aliidongia sp.]|uniref:CsbD family protein n=1 Tax=Aliidongia sp. TaxID=1914230 RepID=UPI002DDC9B46|nr:CsbD family protein [Aliidongia sp.]HEV2676756.1 CsbD family protein [Aliidongia sp.]
MDENQVKGAGRRVIGRIESAAGALTGSAKAELSGRARAAAGEVQENYGAAIDAARSFAVEQPITALLAAAGVGFLVGLYAARR